MRLVKPSKTIMTSMNTDLPISVNDIGEWLNISTDAVLAHTNMLTDLINLSVDAFERYTWYDIAYKTYDLFYESYNNKLVVNLNPIKDFSNITNVYYMDSTNNWIEILKGSGENGAYENMDIRKNSNYYTIYLKGSYPLTSEENVYKIKVTVNTGYNISGLNPVDKIPPMIKLALKKIAAYHYTERGDSQMSGKGMNIAMVGEYPVPQDALGIMNQYSVAMTTFNDILPEGNNYEV